MDQKKDEVTAERKIVVGFSQIGAESEWRTINTESIKEAAKKESITLKFSDAQQKQENQVKALRAYIAQQVDVIVLAPVVKTGWDIVLREAKSANIPVILLDQSVELTEKSEGKLWVTHIGSDFTEEGRRAAKWVVDNADKLELKGDIDVVELKGTVGSASAIDRKKGWEEVMKDYPNFRIIQSQAGDYTRSRGKEITEMWLKSDKTKFKVLFSHNDDMALGAIQAIEEAGLKPGQDIKIVSIDAVKGAFEAMRAGKLNCTVECNPHLGTQLMKAVKDLTEGKKLPERIFAEEGIFPADDVQKE
ncbi:MAG: ABC transporter substrate-binding protein [Clostridia bacterium]|nr:ABC transporter substrate-binding protein [Clostridia bacterium]